VQVIDSALRVRRRGEDLKAGVMATNYPAASHSVKGRSSDLLEKFGPDRNLAGEWTTVSGDQQ
jgi:hypothetical protein